MNEGGGGLGLSGDAPAKDQHGTKFSESTRGRHHETVSDGRADVRESHMEEDLGGRCSKRRRGFLLAGAELFKQIGDFADRVGERDEERREDETTKRKKHRNSERVDQGRKPSISP